MTSVGRILELWRYPVSSLGGERVESLDLHEAGAEGDRAFTLFDAETREPASPETSERWRKALFLTAAYGKDPLPAIGFPDGRRITVDAPDLSDCLSDHFGFRVGLGATHERADGSWPLLAPRYVPSPVHLLTTASLAALKACNETLTIDPRRFRPTALVGTTNAPGFIENDWIGRGMRIGAVALSVTEQTKRCGMTMIAQPGVPEEPEVLRNILRHNRRNLGAYATVPRTGRIAVGDDVSLGEDE